MKRIYIYSFLIGLGEGLALLFGPIFIEPLSYPTSTLAGVLVKIFPFMTENIWWIIVPVFILALPLFIIFVFFLFRKNSQHSPTSFIHASLLFIGGVFASYISFIALALFAISQFRGPSL